VEVASEVLVDVVCVAAIESVRLLTTKIPIGVTSPDVVLCAFRYELPFPITWANDSNCQPFWSIIGYASMNPPMVTFVSSCSRMITPGCLGRAKKLVMAASMGAVLF